MDSWYASSGLRFRSGLSPRVRARLIRRLCYPNGDALPQLERRTLSERERRDATRWDAVLEQRDHPLRHHFGLAGASSGDDLEVPSAMPDCLPRLPLENRRSHRYTCFAVDFDGDEGSIWRTSDALGIHHGAPSPESLRRQAAAGIRVSSSTHHARRKAIGVAERALPSSRNPTRRKSTDGSCQSGTLSLTWCAASTLRRDVGDWPAGASVPIQPREGPVPEAARAAHPNGLGASSRESSTSRVAIGRGSALCLSVATLRHEAKEESVTNTPAEKYSDRDDSSPDDTGPAEAEGDVTPHSARRFSPAMIKALEANRRSTMRHLAHVHTERRNARWRELQSGCGRSTSYPEASVPNTFSTRRPHPTPRVAADRPTAGRHLRRSRALYTALSGHPGIRPEARTPATPASINATSDPCPGNAPPAAARPADASAARRQRPTARFSRCKCGRPVPKSR